jgi:hydroxybutyrate-dimer hydrolase
LRAHGYAEAQDWGIASHDTLNLWRSLNVTYANAYGRFAIEDHICGMSFAGTDAAGRPAAIDERVARQLFANSSGIPPTGAIPLPLALPGINVIADRALGGPILENLAISPSTGRQDLNLDGALCFRSLQTGEGLASGRDWANFARVQVGTRQVEMNGRLHGKPAIVIHGRRDAACLSQLAFARLLRAQSAEGGREEPPALHRGHHRAAFRRIHFARAHEPGRLCSVLAAALLLRASVLS